MRSFVSIAATAFITFLAGHTQAAVVTAWDFNTYDGDAHQIKATFGGGTIQIPTDWSDAGLSNPSGSGLNGHEDQEAGVALGLAGLARNGQHLDILVPVTSNKPLAISTAMRRSKTGFTSVVLTVSTDGGQSFKKVATWKPTEKWSIQSATLPSSEGSKRVLVRMTFDGASGSRGGIRLDNLEVAAVTTSSGRGD